MTIDSTARIDSKANIDSDVTIGAYTVIGSGVTIETGSKIGPHVVINGPTHIGKNNTIFQFASVGEVPQDKKFHGEESKLVIGDGNTIREFVTINRGTEDGGGTTRIGNDNWLMAYIHIAHDCQVGNDTIFSNGASLAGHAVVDDHAILGGFTLVHQFCHIGEYAFCGMGSAISKDVPPYIMINGNPAHPHGINSEGLKRSNFSKDAIKAIKEAYKIIYRLGLTVDVAKEKLTKLAESQNAIMPLIQFIEKSQRGIVR